MQYFWNLLVALSQLTNALLLGDPQETLSQRTGRHYINHPFPSTTAIVFYHVINAIFFWEDDHVAESIDGISKTKEIWEWS